MANTAATSAASSAATGTVTSKGKSKSIDDMNGTDFLKLLITQLTNQDPMEPMKNAELLQQLSGIRSLESNMKMSENLKGLTDGFKTLNAGFQSLASNQDMSNAALLIGSRVVGRTAATTSTDGKIVDGTTVDGVVEKIEIDKNGINLVIGEHKVPLKNVTTVYGFTAADLAGAGS